MKVYDEYRCRRCGENFRSLPRETHSDWLPIRDVGLALRQNEFRPHDCHVCTPGANNVGIGDWIGTIQVQETPDG